jgi:hypothetical protein
MVVEAKRYSAVQHGYRTEEKKYYSNEILTTLTMTILGHMIRHTIVPRMEIVFRKWSVPNVSRCLIILILGLSIFVLYPLTTITQSFSQKSESIDISLLNSSLIPLTNNDANQVRVNVEYTLEDEKIQNQIINAVMEVYASNGTLIRTSTVSGFTVQSDGGEQVLRTTIYDKSLQSVSIKIVFTDLTKKIHLSNTINDDLKLEESSTTD